MMIVEQSFCNQYPTKAPTRPASEDADDHYQISQRSSQQSPCCSNYSGEEESSSTDHPRNKRKRRRSTSDSDEDGVEEDLGDEIDDDEEYDDEGNDRENRSYISPEIKEIKKEPRFLYIVHLIQETTCPWIKVGISVNESDVKRYGTYLPTFARRRFVLAILLFFQ
jgi:hypothetical protein